MIMKPGRVCVKLAGREAGKKCVIIEVNDNNFVTVVGDGMRKRKCNIKHLEPLSEVIKIKKGTSDDKIIKSLK
jgi:large subunit ribosomal protein L14e